MGIYFGEDECEMKRLYEESQDGSRMWITDYYRDKEEQKFYTSLRGRLEERLTGWHISLDSDCSDEDDTAFMELRELVWPYGSGGSKSERAVYCLKLRSERYAAEIRLKLPKLFKMYQHYGWGHVMTYVENLVWMASAWV